MSRRPTVLEAREIETVWIPTPDGVRLAASLWLPHSAQASPVVLEAIPYRRRDSTRAYARYWGRQLAARGVGYARLDIRGSGDSEGLLEDEYLPREQEDAAAAIAWLAEQPWCNGAVGMRGVSWGGFATLQTAALAPPALKAAMALCASDRRYTDDAHFVGGAFALTGLKWATAFKLVMAGPPDPEVVGEGWEAAWRARLEAAPAIVARWLSHQREDAYWRQGSVCRDYAAIRCPLYLVGGWADPYNAAIPRLLAGLQVPTKAVIGPWGHGYPQPATPGPGLAWIDEEARWWRQWLAGEETGVMDGPRLWAFMPEASPAEVAPGPIPGRWVAEPDWPEGQGSVLRLEPGRLSSDAVSDVVAELRSDPGLGLATPEWCPFSRPEYPQEQSADDERSLVFDGDTLAAPLEILGTPLVRLRVAADQPIAQLAARLTEVTADGRSWLVTYGVLNLTHRDSHADPSALDPGVFYDIELPLYPTARRFRAGSKLRLALSEGLWPLLWPSPRAVTLRIDLAGAALELPVRPARQEPAFPIPVETGDRAGQDREPLILRRTHDAEATQLSDGRSLFVDAGALFEEMSPPTETFGEDTGVTVSRAGPDLSLHMSAACPGDQSSWRARQHVRYRRGDWDCGLYAEVEIKAGRAGFEVREALIARLRGQVIFDREVVSEIARDLM